MNRKAKDVSLKLAVAAHQNIKEKDFWLNTLSGSPRKTCFPCDFKKRDTGHVGMAAEKFKFSPELFARLMKVSNGADVKLHIILAAGLTALLEKYTDSKDIMIGSPIYKQEAAGETEFINTVLVLRNQLEADGMGMSFKDLLLQVRKAVREAVENQNYPLELLVEKLDLPVKGDEFPFFDVVLLLQNIHDKTYLKDIHYQMLFSFLRTEDSIGGVVEYDPSQYMKVTIQRMFNHFTLLLQQALFNPDLPLSQVDILSEKERGQILEDFNRKERLYPHDKTIVEIFAEQVKKTPDHYACFEKGKFLTFSELDRQANALAGIIQGLKIG